MTTFNEVKEMVNFDAVAPTQEFIVYNEQLLKLSTMLGFSEEDASFAFEYAGFSLRADRRQFIIHRQKSGKYSSSDLVNKVLEKMFSMIPESAKQVIVLVYF